MTKGIIAFALYIGFLIGVVWLGIKYEPFRSVEDKLSSCLIQTNNYNYWCVTKAKEGKQTVEEFFKYCGDHLENLANPASPFTDMAILKDGIEEYQNPDCEVLRQRLLKK